MIHILYDTSGSSAVFSWLANGYKSKPDHYSFDLLDDYNNFVTVKDRFTTALADPDINFIMIHVVDIINQFAKSHGPDSEEVSFNKS